MKASEPTPTTSSQSMRLWSRICSGISPAFEAEWPEFTIARRQSNGSGLRWRNWGGSLATLIPDDIDDVEHDSEDAVAKSA